MTIDRRAMLGATAAALAGGAAVNLAAIVAAKAANGSVREPLSDPIFALIERHREATLRRLEAGAKYSITSPADPDHDEVKAADDDAYDEQDAAGAALFETKPTTRAGVFALVDYILAFNDGAVALPQPANLGWCSSACEWPEITDDDGTDVTGFAFLKHVADALRAIESKAVTS